MFIRSKNLSYSTILTFFLIILSPMIAFGAEDSAMIQERLSRVESRLNPLQIGGGLSLTGDYYRGGNFESRALELNQDSYLFLDTRIDQNFSLYFLLEQQHRFGDLSFPSIFTLNEAVLRYRSSNYLLDAGRFKFTLDPLGLIADHYTQPIEGLALQSMNKDWYLGGYYSRSFHLMAEDKTTPSPTTFSLGDDEFALRAAIPGADYLVGATLIHQRNFATQEAAKNSLGEKAPPAFETGIGLDLATNLYGGNLQMELAWLTNSNYPQSKTIGWLSTWKKPSSHSVLGIDLWSLPDDFQPNYSSINRLQDGKLIIPGSRGIIGDLWRELPDNWSFTTRAGLMFLDQKGTVSSEPKPVFSGRLKKQFSPTANLEFGFDWGIEFSGNRYQQLIVKTTAYF